MEDSAASAAAAAALPAGWKLEEESASVDSALTSSCGSRMGLEEPAVASAAAPTLDSILQGKAAVTGAGLVKLTDGYQGWALLDPLVVEVEDTATEDSTGLAWCKSSDGKDVRVSIHLNKPLSTSYLQMHTGADVYDKPRVVAAYCNLFLIHMVVAVTDPPPASYHDNFFVYKAHTSMGWLRLLPPFGEWGAQARHFSVVARGKLFIVASFNTSVVGAGKWGEGGADDCKEVCKLVRFHSYTNTWETVELAMPYNPEKGLYQFVWDTDDHFSSNEFFFWVDYHRGILYCDVFSELPFLRFIQLPEINVWDEDHDYSNGRQLPRAYRSVGISRDILTFVDIDNGLFGTKKSSGFMITVWTLPMHTKRWKKEAVLNIDELWSFPRFCNSPLPRWFPEFPVVSKLDRNIVHCILRGPRSDAKAWVVTLDVKNKELVAYKLFSNECKLVVEDCNLDTRNIFLDTPFLCCDFGNDSWRTEIGHGLALNESEGKESLQLDFTEEEESNQRAIRFYLSFMDSPLEDMDDVTIKLRCPACGPRLLKWYNGIPGLIEHAQAETLEMVNAHRKFAKLLGSMRSNAINEQCL